MNDASSATANPDLTDAERQFILMGLRQWRSAATGAPLPIKALDLAPSWPEFDALTQRLSDKIEHQQPLTTLDWTRVLLLVEQAWASELLGAGLDFAIVTSIPDDDAIKLLRDVQRKLRRSGADAELLFPGAGRPPKPFDYTSWQSSN